MLFRSLCRALLEALHGGLKRTNRAQRGIRHARGVAVLPAHNHFDSVVEAGAQEQIEPGKAANVNVIAESVFDFLRTPHDQLACDATVVENLAVEFDAELVARSVLPRGEVLPQIREPTGERFGILM